MNRHALEERLAQMRQDLESGRMTRENFEREAGQLGYQEPDGTWFRIDPATGGWFKWNGSRWLAETPVPNPSLSPSPEAKFTFASTLHRPDAIPRLFPLLKQILHLTIKNFLRRLPLTLVFMAATSALYFWLMVVRWDGYEPNFSSGPYANLERFIAPVMGVGVDAFTPAATGISGAVLLGVVTTLLLGFLGNLFRLGPFKAIGNLLSIPVQLGSYFRQAGSSALSGLAGGAGLAVLIGCFMGSWANLALAVGAGAMIASKGGQVMSLLLRSLWHASFGIAQGRRPERFPQAAAYVAMFGGSLGFILRSVVPAEAGIFLALGLLVAALVLALAGRGPAAPVPTALLVVALNLTFFFLAVQGYAHDGGLPEAIRDYPNLPPILAWLKSQGSGWAALNCLLPGMGFGLGPAFWAALNQILKDGAIQGLSASGGGNGSPPLIDPDTGEPLVVHDGRYEGGKPGQVWYDGEWMDPDEARRWIAERQHQLAQRDKERADFWRDVERDKDAQRQRRDQDLYNQGYRWDEGENAWVKKHPSPEDNRLDEFYRRGDWIKEHMDHLTPAQQQAAQRILDRAGFRDSGVDMEDISDADMDTLRRLSHAINDFRTGQSEGEGANAERDAANAQLAEQTAAATAQLGQMAASRFDPTAGALTGFVYGGLQNWDKGLGGAVKHGAVNGIGNWVDNKIGGLAPESIALNAASGGTTNAAQAWLLGGSRDDIKNAAALGALGGAAGAGSRQLQRYLDDVRLPHISPGDDPTLAPGSRGLGSNDLDAPPRDPRLPTTPSHGDPTLAPGSRGLGSNDLDVPSRSPATPAVRPQGDPTLAPGSRGIGSNDLDVPSSCPATTPIRPQDDPALAPGSRGLGSDDLDAPPRSGTGDGQGDPDASPPNRQPPRQAEAGDDTPARTPQAEPEGDSPPRSPAGDDDTGQPRELGGADEPPDNGGRQVGEQNADGSYDLDADGASDSLSRKYGQPISPDDPFQPQVAPKDCSNAAISKATGLSYEETDKLIRDLRTHYRDNDGNILEHEGGLPRGALENALNRTGAKVEPVNKDGLIDLGDVRARLEKGERIVAAMNDPDRQAGHAIGITGISTDAQGAKHLHIDDPARGPLKIPLDDAKQMRLIDWNNSYFVKKR